MSIPNLADGQSYVQGRSSETAQLLIEAAGDRAAEVVTTSFGYIVPTEFVPEGVEAHSNTTGETTEEATESTEDKEEGTGGAVEFDPTSATIAEVKDYLDGADAAERERVLAAEGASEKPRKGVLDLAEAPEGAK